MGIFSKKNAKSLAPLPADSPPEEYPYPSSDSASTPIARYGGDTRLDEKSIDSARRSDPFTSEYTAGGYGPLEQGGPSETGYFVNGGPGYESVETDLFPPRAHAFAHTSSNFNNSSNLDSTDSAVTIPSSSATVAQDVPAPFPAAFAAAARDGSVNSSGSGTTKRRRRVWTSTALSPGEVVEKPWLVKKGVIRKTRPKNLWSYFLFLIGIIIGVGLGAFLVWQEYSQLPKGEYCLMMDEDFTGSDLNSAYWSQDVSIGGHNVGDFSWYSGLSQNVYLDGNSNLVILPTLTSDYQLDTSQISIDSSTCTGASDTDCSIQAGDQTAINPVMSGRINTKGKVEFTYGRVEISAKMATGDFIWPQIMLMPVDSVYGEYPASGQIDIGESRGNIASKRDQQLNNEFVSGLHWGPSADEDRFSLTQGLYKVYRSFFTDQYYTFGVDWTPDSVFIWVNTRVRKAMNLGFKKKTFWERGSFSSTYSNGSLISNPWTNSSNQFIAPFDQPFFLSVGVNVGGTNGYWDDVANKPWEDTNTLGGAMYSFVSKQSDWYSTWPSSTNLQDRALMWKYGSC